MENDVLQHYMTSLEYYYFYYARDRLKYTQQKKLRKSQKTMQHENIKANNYLIFIYLFRYMSSVRINVYFSLLVLVPLLWHSVK